MCTVHCEQVKNSCLQQYELLPITYICAIASRLTTLSLSCNKQIGLIVIAVTGEMFELPYGVSLLQTLAFWWQTHKPSDGQ